MNFLQILNERFENFYADQEDIDILNNIIINKIELCESKQSCSKFKRPYYHWFAELNGKQIELNLNRSHYFNHKFKIYCQRCHKEIKQYTISQMFKMKYNNTIIFNNHAHFYCKKCATHLNSINGQEKSKQTCLRKYGVEYSFQSENNKQKTLKTKLEKYGENWKEICKKILNNKLYGPDKRDKNGKLLYHNGNNLVTRAKMVEAWKKTVAKKSPEEISKWRKAIITKTKSKISIECLDNLSNKLNLIIEREKPVYTYHIDGLIENKCILEFFGNYWHANPEIYNKNDILSYHGKLKSVVDIWANDKKRLEKIQSVINLPVIIIWEQSYINNKSLLVEQVADYINKGELKNGQIYYF